jgi:hypothetical protein
VQKSGKYFLVLPVCWVGPWFERHSREVCCKYITRALRHNTLSGCLCMSVGGGGNVPYCRCCELKMEGVYKKAFSWSQLQSVEYLNFPHNHNCKHKLGFRCVPSSSFSISKAQAIYYCAIRGFPVVPLAHICTSV